MLQLDLYIRQLLLLYSLLILLTDMAREAGAAALNDAGICYQDVEAVVASYCYGEPTSGKVMTGTCSFTWIYSSIISQLRQSFTCITDMQTDIHDLWLSLAINNNFAWPHKLLSLNFNLVVIINKGCLLDCLSAYLSVCHQCSNLTVDHSSKTSEIAQKEWVFYAARPLDE